MPARTGRLAAAGPVAVLVLLASLTGGPAAVAQPLQGTIAGTVTDAENRPVGGATVTVENSATRFRRSTRTDDAGRYIFTAVPVDAPYDLLAEAAGFAPAVWSRVVLAHEATTTVDFRLSAGLTALTESISVWAAEPSYIDRTALQQTINDRLAHALPLDGREMLSLAALTAGVAGTATLPTPQGQMFWSNNVIVDGASHYSKWRSAARAFHSGYGLEAVREVQVLTSRYSAEFGEALASVTSVITRAGSNQLAGTALVFVQNDALDAAPAFAIAAPDRSAGRFGVTIGGPVERDRTFYFANYEGRAVRERNIVVSPAAPRTAVPDDEDEHLLFVRADHQTGRGHLFTARYNGQRLDWHNEPGGLTLPGSGLAFRNDVDTLLVSDAFRIGTRLLGTTRFQFARYVDERRDLQAAPLLSISGVSLEGGALGPYGYGADPEDTWEAAATFTYGLARHAVKFGAAFKHVRARNASLPYGYGAFFFADLAATEPYLYRQSIAPSPEAAVVEPRTFATQVFLQDDWRPTPGLTLTAGARYDVESIRNVRGFAATDRNNLQPRLGVGWSPGLPAALTVRGGLGIYTQQHLLYEINRVALEGESGAIALSLGSDSPLTPRYPDAIGSLPSRETLPPRDLQRVSDDFRNPYSLQASAGAAWMLFGTSLSADYVWLNGYDLMSLVDANAPASNVKPAARSVADADATRPTRPVAGGFRKLLTLGNEGRSWYRALQIRAGRGRGRLHGVASYTFASAEDMANYLLPEDSRNLPAERGPADNDIRHNLAFGVAIDLPGATPPLRGWSLSAVGTFRSATPYTVMWGDDRNGTTQNDARPGGRNTARGGAYRTVDLALVKRVPVGHASVEARGEVFNLLNAINYAQYVGALASPYFARPIAAFPMRRVQLAAVVKF